MKLSSERLVNDSTKLMYTIKGESGEADNVLKIGDALDTSRYASFVEYSDSKEEPYYIMLVDIEASSIFEEDYEELL